VPLTSRRRSPPSAQDAALARVSGRVLARHAGAETPLRLRFDDRVDMEPIDLPVRAVTLLVDILSAMAAGQAFTLVPEAAELTSVQAADVLGVSRPFLIKLLDEGRIPYRKLGRHRRVRLDDVMAYKRAIDAEREAVLDRLVAEAQAEDMGYARP